MCEKVVKLFERRLTLDVPGMVFIEYGWFGALKIDDPCLVCDLSRNAGLIAEPAHEVIGSLLSGVLPGWINLSEELSQEQGMRMLPTESLAIQSNFWPPERLAKELIEVAENRLIKRLITGISAN